MPVTLLKELMLSTIFIPYDWGRQEVKGLLIASSVSGANVNILAANGLDNVGWYLVWRIWLVSMC